MVLNDILKSGEPVGGKPDGGIPGEGSDDPGGTLLALAPMAEISHSAFRHLAEGFGGCDILFTEMLSVAALLNSSPYESFYTNLSPAPEKTVIQLVGSRPEIFLEAAEKLADSPAAGFDINMGCSIGTIRKKGWGIELMNNPDKAREIVKLVRRTVPGKTLSVKLRLGFKEDEKSLLDFCMMLIDEGVDFITLNPKTGKVGRNRPGMWMWVAILRERLSIPVLGNSDVTDWETYSRRRSNADGVMIGRGAVACPWIFALIKGKAKNPDFSITINLKKTAEDFFTLLKKYQPRDFYLSRTRRFFFYFTENMKFGHRIKYDIQNASSLDLIEDLVYSYFERNPEEILRVYS